MAMERKVAGRMLNPNLAQTLTSMMDQHKKDNPRSMTDDQRLQQFQQLGKMTKHRRAAKKVIKNKATIRTLLDSVKAKPRFSKMVEYSLECLTNLAFDEVSVEEIVDEGALEVISDILKINPYNEDIMRMANKCLSRMCVNERMTQIIADKFGSERLIHSLNKHVDDETQIATCRTVTTMMKKGGVVVVDKFVEDGVIEALADLIKRNPKAADVVAAASEALAEIAAANPAHVQRIMDTGVAQHVLDALKNNPHNAQLAKHVIDLLNQMAAADPAIKEALRKMGAVDIIVAALEANPDNEDLLALGAQAMALLADESDVSNALDTMTTGNTSADKAKAMATVGSLALVEENVEYIVATGGIPAIIAALKSAKADGTDANNILMLEAGFRGLGRLAVNENNIYTIFKEGGAKLCISAMKDFLHNEKVVAAAMQTLSKLCTRKENGEYICKSGGVLAALAALQAHPHSERVAQAFIDLVSAIACHPENIPYLVESGCIEALVAIMKTHMDNPDILKGAIVALGGLAVSEENIRRIKTAGGLEALIEAITKHMDNTDLLEQALLLLETCALMPENLDPLRKMGALDAVLKAMETHPDHEAIQEIGARTLGLFATSQQIEAIVGQVREYVGQLQRSQSDVLSRGIMAKLNPALNLLGNLALVEENLAIMQTLEVMDAVAQCFEVAMGLKDSDEKKQLLLNTVKTIVKLAGNDSHDQFLVESGVLGRILDAALQDPDNEALAEQALLLTEKLASNPSCVPGMVEQGVVGKVIALADAHGMSVDILSAAARILGLIASSCPEAVPGILAAKGHAVAVESVINHMDNAEDLKVALAVLSNLAIDEAAVNALLEAGALEAVLEAMKSHMDDPEVLNAAMKCLGRMCVTEGIAKLMGEKGALQLITDAMRQHHDNEELIATGVMLLDSLAMVLENGKLMLEELGGRELMEWAMESYPENAIIMESAQNAIGHMDSVEGRLAELEAAEEKQVHLEAINAAALLTALEGPLTRDELMRHLQQVQALLNMEDLGPAQEFIAKGGLDALGMLCNQNLDNDVLKATAASMRQIAEKMELLFDDPNALSAMNLPNMTEALVEMVMPHAEFAEQLSVEEMAAACQLLGDLAGKPENVQMLLDRGAIDQLVQMLNSDDANLIEAAARVLAKMSNYEAAALLLANPATLRALIEAMKKHKDKPNFLKFSVYLLGNIAINDQIKTQIGLLGGIQLIIEIMGLYPDIRPLVENCCYALANLSVNNEVNMGMIVANNGIFHLVIAMNNHMTAEELLDSAICALSNLCYKSDTNKELIVKSGGAKAVVDASLANFNNSELLMTCFRCLGNLAFFPPNISVIIREGGVQSIVAGITVHGNVLDLIQVALGVLTNLAADLDAENMAIMAQEGAVQAIVEVLGNHRDNPSVSVPALGCLCNLGREDYNSIMIVKQGGTANLVASVSELHFDAEVVGKGLTLAAILSKQRVNVDRMMQDGVAQCIGSTLTTEKRAEQTAVDGVRCFGNMSFSAENANVLAAQGCVQAVLSVLQYHMNSAPVVIECMRCLSDLCRTDSNADAMALAAMKSAETALQMHYKDSKLVVFTLSFLANLCVHRTAAENVTQTQLVHTVLQNMRSHIENLAVGHRACKVLENMALASDTLREFMRSKGAVETLEELKAATTNVDLKTDIDVVIAAIMKNKGKVKKTRDMRRARDLFGDEEKDDDELNAILEEDIRNFLVSGALLMKHSKTAKPRPRHVWVSNDLKWLMWKDPDKPTTEDTPRMKINRIRSVDKGRCTHQLKRTNFRGKAFAKEECSFAVIGRERTVDLEAKTEADRDRWAKCLLRWVTWNKAVRKLATRF